MKFWYISYKLELLLAAKAGDGLNKAFFRDGTPRNFISLSLGVKL